MVKKLLATYIVLIVLPLTTVSVISFMLFKNNMENQIASSMERTMTLLHREIDHYFGQFLDLSETIMLQRNLLDIVHLRNMPQAVAEIDDFEAYQQASEINVFINYQLLNKFKEISAVHLYTESGEIYHAQRSGTVLHRQLLDDLKKSLLHSGDEWIWMFMPGESQPSLESSIYLIRQIHEPFTGASIAMMVLEIQLHVLAEKMTSAALPHQDIVLLGDRQLVVYDPGVNWKRTHIEKPVRDVASIDIGGQNDRTLITYATSSRSKWTVISYMKYAALMHDVNRISISMIFVSIVCILLSIVTAIMIALRIVRPIRTIRNGMRRLAAGNFDIQIPISGKDEVAELSRGFNKMSRQLEETINQVYLVQLAQKNAELRALQAQIDPHFLYNTLDAIRMVAEMEGSSNAGEMVSSLAVLFRAATESDTLVTVEQELHLIRHYAKLREIRFDGKIDIQFNTDPATLHRYIPKLTLQPFVENAFNHGLMSMPPPRFGKIDIKTYIHDEQVMIEIKDNGIGMDESDLQRVRQRLEHADPSGQSVGILNVHNRIRLKWGEQSGVSISSKLGFGTIVVIKLPIIDNKEDTRS